MRTIFRCLSVCLMAFLCSCSNDDEPYRLPLDEFQPIKIQFMFVDKDGSDLLEPSNPNNVLEKCYASFRNVKYILGQSSEDNPNDVKSNVNFQGLKLVRLNDKYAIEFGELDGSYYYKNENLNIVFENQGNLFKIYSIWTWGDDGLPQFIREYKRGEHIVASNTATPIIEIEKVYTDDIYGK